MTQGRVPQQGQGVGMPDFQWLLGLAGGDNNLCQDVVAFAGGGQAGAVPVGVPNAQGIQASLIRVKTCATNLDSIQLPQAIRGKYLLVFNSTAQTCNAYASPTTNKATAALDTINGAANANAITMAAVAAAGTGYLFFCPADGVWAAMKSG